MMAHERRRFVQKVDYVTSPGFGHGPGWRTAQGLPGGGPAAIITTYGVFRFDSRTKRAVLVQRHPETDIETIRRETGWPLNVSPDLTVTPLPALEELAWIRRFDPRGVWTGG